MNPWRAALTSATASGNRTCIALRSASACSPGSPETSMRFIAAAVSSTAVFSVSVANCSRCASATFSACCSANSRSPRISSSGSPPKGNPKPLPSTASVLHALAAQRQLVLALDLVRELVDDADGAAHRFGERRRPFVAERALESGGCRAYRVEERRRGETRRRAQHLLEL